MVHEDAGLVVYIGAKNRRGLLTGGPAGVVKAVDQLEEKPSVAYADDQKASRSLESHHLILGSDHGNSFIMSDITQV